MKEANNTVPVLLLVQCNLEVIIDVEYELRLGAALGIVRAGCLVLLRHERQEVGTTTLCSLS